MTVLVRTATPEEYASVGELTAQAYLDDGFVPEGSNYDDTLRAAHERALHSDLLVAQDADTGELLGTVSYVRPGSPYAGVSTDGEAEFRMLAVATRARGRGVGRLLVQACLDRAVTEGASQVVLSTATDMATAHRLYESFGFVRLPDRDWRPLPSVLLLAYGLDLRPGSAAS